MDTLQFVAACRVDMGHVRTNNEDNVYFSGCTIPSSNADKPFFNRTDIHDGIGIFAVFDGMGGESFGEFASMTAAVTLGEYDNQLRFSPLETVNDLIKSYTKDTNDLICRRMTETNTRIGSTYAILCFRDQRALAFNIGDSRIYLVRDGAIRQISEDHNTAAQMTRLGLSSSDERRLPAGANMPTQHLGIFEDELLIEPYAAPPVELRSGDFFLLCSDGLTGMVEDTSICAIVTGNGSVEEKVNILTDEALKNGGKDNASVILVAVLSGEEPPAEDTNNPHDKKRRLLSRLFSRKK